MPCFRPLNAWKSNDLDDVNPITGKSKMVFQRDRGLESTHCELPCGQCIGCRLDRARSWAVRCLHEAKSSDENCFVTLTYDNFHLPANSSLCKRDIQLFLKRLRKAHPERKIRYFLCGEYGGKTQRPHYHIILFNYDFPDKKLTAKRKDNEYYLSPELLEYWNKGGHTIGNLTFDSACYTARYILKKVTGQPAEEHYKNRQPEFTLMSRKPGLGKEFYEKFTSDVYNFDKVVVSDDFICRPPVYYDRMYDMQFPERFAQLKEQRRDRALNNPENTDDRRYIKHQIANIKQSQILRPLEDQY